MRADTRRGGQRRLGALVLAEQTLPVPPTAEAAEISPKESPRRLRPPALDQGSDAMARPGDFSAPRRGRAWPDLSDEAWRDSADDWLAPFSAARRASPRSTPRISPLRCRRFWLRICSGGSTPRRRPISKRRLARASPSITRRRMARFSATRAGTLRPRHPSGAGRGPGAADAEFLSPAHRPIQITRDLPGFWRGSWAAVKTEMKGRYPRHFLAGDPAKAAPTTRAKPRGT